MELHNTLRTSEDAPSAVLVTVIVLTYNHAAYVRQALDSILAQETGFQVEILVGDDASVDATPEIVVRYAKDHADQICAFLRKKNIGGTANLADLLRRAKGKYIIGCEGDDYWTSPTKLARQVAYLESHGECSGCTHPVTVVDAGGTPLDDQHLPWICDKPVYTLRDFKGVFLPGHPVTLMHRNVFEERDLAFIAQAHPQIADRTIAMIVAARGQIHRLDDAMACYRKIRFVGAGNLTSQLYINRKDSKLDDYRMTDKLERYARDELKQDVSFDWFRRNLVLRAAAKAVMNPSVTNRSCLLALIKEWRAKGH
jgi:glycosyltransferase involved in cell wall biosynthesis